MAKTAGPIVSSSIAERMPPCMKPAGLQKSGLPSKPMRIQPSPRHASSRRRPSSLDDGGGVKLSKAVAHMGPSVRLLPKAVLLPTWCQQAARPQEYGRLILVQPCRFTRDLTRSQRRHAPSENERFVPPKTFDHLDLSRDLPDA